MPLDLCSPCLRRNALISLTRSSGQAVVEFTLVFFIFLVIAWIPADFGLAFYTAQLAQNASREGARIAAADPKLGSGTASCTMPSCSGNILSETAARISSALSSRRHNHRNVRSSIPFRRLCQNATGK